MVVTTTTGASGAGRRMPAPPPVQSSVLTTPASLSSQMKQFPSLFLARVVPFNLLPSVTWHHISVRTELLPASPLPRSRRRSWRARRRHHGRHGEHGNDGAAVGAARRHLLRCRLPFQRYCLRPTVGQPPGAVLSQFPSGVLSHHTMWPVSHIVHNEMRVCLPGSTSTPTHSRRVVSTSGA